MKRSMINNFTKFKKKYIMNFESLLALGYPSYFKNFKKGFAHLNVSTTNVQRPGDSSIKTVTLIPGVGIGREITECLLRIHAIIKPPIKWDVINEFTFENETFK